MTLLAGATEVVTRSGLLPIAELTGRRCDILVPKVTPYGIHGHGSFQPVEVRSGGAQPLWAVSLHRGRQTRVIHTAAGQVWLTRVRKLRPSKPDGGHNGYETVTATAPTNELASGDRVRSLKAHPPLRTGMVPFAVAQGFVYGDGTKASGGRPADLTIYDQGKDRALLPYFAAHEARPIMANGKEALRIYGLPRLWKGAPDFRESRAFLLSWLAGYFAADGTVTTDGSARMSSASSASMAVIRNIAAVCGIGYGPVRSAMRVGTGEWATALYTITLAAPDLPDWFFIINSHAERNAAKAQSRERHERNWTIDSAVPTGEIAEVYKAIVPGAAALALSEDLMTGAFAGP
ncbi:hypothetical protein [Streptomyces sasae]|uniref:hypothetical protein n=1 Tax=Streptomyces sasae TaxID=1266772 RepID=UPI0029303659|nr:hypothetical protein [Streptomyces sasae]